MISSQANKRIKLESVKNEFGYYFHEIIRSEVKSDYL